MRKFTFRARKVCIPEAVALLAAGMLLGAGYVPCNGTPASAAPEETLRDTVYTTRMPAVFRNTHPDTLAGSEALRPFFDRIRRKNGPVRLVHLGDSHVRGHVFTRVVRERLESAWGNEAVEPQDISYRTTALARETGKPGLVYHALGVNGATLEGFLTKERMQEVRRLCPDLLILSFGTNESHAGQYDAARHQDALNTSLRLLQDSFPNVPILLTTPPGSYLRQRTRRNGRTRTVYVSNRNTARTVDNLRQAAREHGLALWDLHRIAGDESACRNWVAAGLMRPDRVHYQPAGYALQGNLLADAILNAYHGTYVEH